MKEYSACTTILVGKKASIDGTTMIARNDDTFRPITPQKFIIEPARHGEKKHIKSWLNKFEITSTVVTTTKVVLTKKTLLCHVPNQLTVTKEP
jgi:dipeptidase